MLCATDVWGATYWISANGSEATYSATTSCSDAMTIATHNAAGDVFSPADIIYLCDTDGAFRTTLIVQSSGTANNPIIYQVAPGDSPIIYGGDTMTTWTSYSSNTWQKTGVTTEPFVVKLDGIALLEGSDRDSLADHEWVWASDVLYVRDETGDPDGSVTIEATQRNNGVILNAHDYITFDGLRFKMFGRAAYPYGGAISDYDDSAAELSTNITINECIFTNNLISISGLADTGGTGSDDWTITDNTIDGPPDGYGIINFGPSGWNIDGNAISNLQNGILIAGSGANSPSNIIINNNTITGYGTTTAGSGNRFGIAFATTGGDTYVITNNTITSPAADSDAYELGFYHSPTTVTITGNSFDSDGSAYGDSGLVVDMYDSGQATISNNVIAGADCLGMFILGGSGHTISNNYISESGNHCAYTGYGLGIVSGDWNGADRTATNHVVSYNIITDSANYSIILTEAVAGTTSGIKFYNNTLWDVNDYGFIITDGDYSSIEFKNNIVDSDDSSVFLVRDDAEVGTYDNNLYYASADVSAIFDYGTDDTIATLANWRTACVGDANAPAMADPAFVSATDFRITAGSDALLGGTDVGLSTDIQGKTIHATTPTIGAIEGSQNYYYMNAVGTATTAGNALNCNANMAMSIATHNGLGDAFSPADIIYLCDTDGDFTTPLVVQSSGSTGAGNVITYMNAPGDTVTFDGVTVKSGWTSYAGSTYQKTQSNAVNVYQIFEDGTRLAWEADGRDAMAAGSWTEDAGVIYIRSSDNADPDTHTIEYMSDPTDTDTGVMIDFNGQDYITFDGINVTKANQSSYGTLTTGSDYITIQNCEVSYAGERNILIGVTGDNSDMNVTYATISNVVAHDSLDPEIWVGRGNNFTISGCTVYNVGADINPNGKLYPKYGDGDGKEHFPDGILFRNMNTLTIENNYIYDIYGNGCLHGEYSGAMEASTGIIVRQNHLKNTYDGGPSSAFRTSHDGIEIYYNIIESTYDYAVHTLDFGAHRPDSLNFYNNVFYSGASAGHTVYLQDGTNLDFKNNIYYRNGGTTNRYITVTADSTSGFASNYNLYYVAAAGTNRWFWAGSVERTAVADWRSDCSCDANPTTNVADPVFVNAGTGNFKLASKSSPAWDAGTPVGLTEDYAGVGVPRYTNPDIGAYEFNFILQIGGQTIGIGN